MLKNSLFCSRCRSLSRYMSTKVKYVANIESEMNNQFEAGLRHRLHCGRRQVGTISLPTQLESAALRVINKYNSHKFKEDVSEMFKRIIDHQLPPEPHEIKLKEQEIKERVAAKDGIDLNSLSDEVKSYVIEERRRKTARSLRDSLINHQPIDYDEYWSVVYMAARLPANYAALMAVFQEIKKDLPDFKPQTLFDFGSGVGTTIWAAEEVWPKAFDEYFCVDICKEMNELSELILKGGHENKKPIYDPVFYRQYLPVSNNIKYDLVVSAFSLLDIPDAKNRIHVIENLWHKTQDMLVIVEHGSRAGFAAVLEARNFILQLSGHKITSSFTIDPKSLQISTERETTDATILAPCSHDLTCPRQTSKGPVLCNFQVAHNPLLFGQQKVSARKERYSYVVLRKTSEQSDLKSWPRIVQPVLTSHHKAICRFCCSDGQIKEVIFTKAKHDKHSYRCARISEWGDKFPASIEPMKITEN